ncbi:putative protein xylosyltransferase activity [Lyophyllum shimeji]|uniref:Uncharacterized protein n=1 Tax=Lyophyllum shimeji TaxID=47721 RepID=A0A9P3PYG5_LYOSH|nr:putative protein xylosyltransferase activity [Lyophyllum shimeji]
MLRGASAPPWVMIGPKTPCKFSPLAPVGQYWPPPQCLRTTELQPVPLVSQLFRQRSQVSINDSQRRVDALEAVRYFFGFQALWSIFREGVWALGVERSRSSITGLIGPLISQAKSVLPPHQCKPSTDRRRRKIALAGVSRLPQYKRAQTRGSESLMALSSRIYIVLAVSFLALKSAFALNLQRRQAASCTQTTASAFNLVARYRDAPTSTILVKVIDVDTVPKVGYSILSTCASCISSWSYNALENGALLPKSASNPYLRTVSYSLVEGESPSFISIQFPPPPASGYCSTDHVVDLAGAPLLGANGRTDQWSLCPNSTANRRVDVVWSPKAGHSHYRIEDCQAVDLEQV